MSTQPVNIAVEQDQANAVTGNLGRRWTDYGRRRTDLIGLLGLAIAVGGILIGQVMEGGRVTDVLQPTAAIIVFGGTIGAVILTTPRSMLKSAMHRLRDLLSEEEISWAAEQLAASIVAASIVEASFRA